MFVRPAVPDRAAVRTNLRRRKPQGGPQRVRRPRKKKRKSAVVGHSSRRDPSSQDSIHVSDVSENDSEFPSEFFRTHWQDGGNLGFLPPDFRTFLRSSFVVLRTYADGPRAGPPPIDPVSRFLLGLSSDRLAILMNSKLGSEVMQCFLPFVTKGVFVALWEKLEKYGLLILRGNFSSFVMEGLVRGLSNFFPAATGRAAVRNATNWIALVFGDFLRRLDADRDFLKMAVMSKSACPVVRCIIQQVALYGSRELGDSGVRFVRSVVDVLEETARDHRRKDLIQDPLVAPLIGVLFRSSHQCGILHRLLGFALFGPSLDEEVETKDFREGDELDFVKGAKRIRRLSMSKTGSHVVQELVQSLSMLQLKTFVEQSFGPTLEEGSREPFFRQLAFHPLGNFVVGTIFARCTTKPLFLSLWSLLFGDTMDGPAALAALWDARRRRVVENILRGCIRFAISQKEFVRGLFFDPLPEGGGGGVRGEGGENSEPSDTTFSLGWKKRTILRFLREVAPTEKPDDASSEFRIVTPGCCLLGLLYEKFSWRELILLNDGLHQILKNEPDPLDGAPRLLPLLSKNGAGAVFLNRFFTLFKKNRALLIHFRPFVADLATHRIGARVIEKSLRLANVRIKKVIARTLVENEEEVKSTVFGSRLFSKFKLHKLKAGKTYRVWLHSLTKDAQEPLLLPRRGRRHGKRPNPRTRTRLEDGMSRRVSLMGRGRGRGRGGGRGRRSQPNRAASLKGLDWLGEGPATGKKRLRKPHSRLEPRKRRRQEAAEPTAASLGSFVVDASRVPAWLKNEG